MSLRGELLALGSAVHTEFLMFFLPAQFPRGVRNPLCRRFFLEDVRWLNLLSGNPKEFWVQHPKPIVATLFGHCKFTMICKLMPSSGLKEGFLCRNESAFQHTVEEHFGCRTNMCHSYWLQPTRRVSESSWLLIEPGNKSWSFEHAWSFPQDSTLKLFLYLSKYLATCCDVCARLDHL